MQKQGILYGVRHVGDRLIQAQLRCHCFDARSCMQAVTIDDVVCVINSGRHKEKSYDPYTSVSTLQGAWISKASERQRRGRAGRCQQAGPQGLLVSACGWQSTCLPGASL